MIKLLGLMLYQLKNKHSLIYKKLPDMKIFNSFKNKTYIPVNSQRFLFLDLNTTTTTVHHAAIRDAWSGKGGQQSMLGPGLKLIIALSFT